MERFIDHLSKRLAKAVSRRDMLSITSRTIFGTLVSSTGINKLWASNTTLGISSSQACPSCGACVRCNLNSGQCKENCERCTAAMLCSQAQQFAPYVTLYNFFSAQFTESEPQAMVVINKDDTITSVLGTPYTSSDPSRTATLFFTTSVRGLNAYAVQYVDGMPQSGYVVASNGQIEQLLPPYQLPSATEGAVVGAGIRQLSPFTSTKMETAHTTSSCTVTVSSLCNAALNYYALSSFLGCLFQAVEYCEEGILIGPEVPPICFLVLGGVCSLRAAFVPPLENQCSTVYSNLFCSCPSGQEACGDACCGPCTICSNGICTSISCPSGYSCSSTGTCSCDNFCGTSCCSPNESCVNGGCTSACPTGATTCGAICCSSTQTCSNGACITACPSGTTACGEACCSSGQTCSNGQCASACPSGTTACGTTCCSATEACVNGNCRSGCGDCAAGYIKCGGAASCSCCGVNDICCSDGTNLWCCAGGGYYKCGTYPSPLCPFA